MSQKSDRAVSKLEHHTKLLGNVADEIETFIEDAKEDSANDKSINDAKARLSEVAGKIKSLSEIDAKE